jgi:hypothetical protein
MPLKKKRNPVHMRAAVAAMRNKEMGSIKATRLFNVSQSTLVRYVKNVEIFPVDIVKSKIRRKLVLPPAKEIDLADYCLLMEERLFYLAQKEFRHIGYQLAVKKGIANPFPKDSEQAGKKWTRNFFKVFIVVSLRQ